MTNVPITRVPRLRRMSAPGDGVPRRTGSSRRTVAPLLVAALALAGCQTWTAPFSEVTGDRYHLATLNTSPTSIYQIDGEQAYPIGRGRPYYLEPGRRIVKLTAVPLNPRWSAGMRLVDFELDAKPCMRYYIAARFENPLGPDFTPFIDEVEPIEYCRLAAAR